VTTGEIAETGASIETIVDDLLATHLLAGILEEHKGFKTSPLRATLSPGMTSEKLNDAIRD